MVSARAFLGLPAQSAPTDADASGDSGAAPAPAPKKTNSAREFLGVSAKGGKADQPAAPSAPEEKGYVDQMIEAYGEEGKGAVDQLKADWEKAGPNSPEMKAALKKGSFVDYVKADLHGDLAMAKIAPDLLGTAWGYTGGGVLAATLGLPFGKGMNKAMNTLLPGSEQMIKEGKMEGGEKFWRDKFMQASSLAMPVEGAAGAAGAAGRGARGLSGVDTGWYGNARRVGQPKQVPMGTVAHHLSKFGLDKEEFARRYAGRKLKEEGVSLEEAKRQVSKPGASISDIGKHGMVEAGEQAALQGEGRRLAQNLYHEERMKGREARMAQTVDRAVSDKNFYESVDGLVKNRKEASTPVYDEAFSGGSTAVLIPKLTEDVVTANQAVTKAQEALAKATEAHKSAEKSDFGGSHGIVVRRFEKDVSDAGRAVNEAMEEKRAADNALTQVHAKFGPESDNVYHTSARNKAIAEAEARVAAAEDKVGKAHSAHDEAREGLATGRTSATESIGSNKVKAQQALERAKQQRQKAMDRLNTAHEQEAEGVNGGLWSPRLQEFLDMPVIQRGMRHGIELMQWESVGANKPFNPSEYAFKPKLSNSGQPVISETGQPVGDVASVPTLRILDAGKRGLDAIIAKEGRNELTGEMNATGRALSILRRGFVDELSALTKDTNPAYNRARQIYEGESRILDAMQEGRTFAKQAPEEITKYMGDLNAAEKEAYKIGMARWLSDQMSETGSGASRLAARIEDSTRMKERLRTALGEKEAQEVIDMAERETEYARRGSKILGGSQTARRMTEGKAFEEIAPVLDELIEGSRNGFNNFFAEPMTHIKRVAGGWIYDKLSAMSSARREALGKLLFSTNKEDNIQALELMYKEGDVTVPRIGNRAAGGVAARATPNLQGDKPTEEPDVEELLKQ
jgi:hypothetical protein